MHCRKANKTKQNLSHQLLLLKHIWSLSNNHSFYEKKCLMSHRTETKHALSWRRQRNDTCWRKMRMRSSESQSKTMLLQHKKVKKWKASIRTKIKCWKYLSESFSWDVAVDSGWGKKYDCTVQRPEEKTSREEERRGETVSTSLARQGEKQRERCASEQPFSYKPLPALSRFSYALLFSCPLQPRCQEREVTTAWEGKRKQSGNHLADRSLASSVVVGLAASPPCLIPL